MSEWDHRLKLRRAAEHLEALEHEVEGWFDGSHHRVRIHRDRNSLWDLTMGSGGVQDYASLFIQGDEPPSDPFSLLIGDCLHNLRSSLDALAYELAIAHTKPLTPEIAEDSEFPIFGDEDRQGRLGTGSNRFRDNGRNKIRGVDPNAQAEVERLQPYYRGAAYRKHPLWRLHDLDRLNKHRLLHTVAWVGVGMTIHPAAGSGNTVLNRILDLKVKSVIRVEHVTVTQQEARFAHVPWPSDVSEAEMQMQFRPTLKITLKERATETDPESITEELGNIHNFILDSVLPRLEPFLT